MVRKIKTHKQWNIKMRKMFMSLILKFLKAIFLEPIFGLVTNLSQNFKFLREQFHNQLNLLKILFTFYFHLSINTGTLNTLLDHFWVMTSPRGVKTSKFWDSSFKDEYVTSNFTLLLTFIFLSQLVHEVHVWAPFDPILC